MANFSDPYLLNKQDIEATVKEALKSSIGLKCKFPLDLFKIIEMWGIDIETKNNSKDSDLALIRLTQCPKIIINTEYNIEELKEKIATDCQSFGSLRFSIAHELGHFFLKIHNNEEIRNKMIVDSSAYYKGKYISMTEHQANQFAAALLMPEFAMKDYIDYKNKPIEMAQKIANNFGVSLTTAFLRLAKLSHNIAACIHVNLKDKNIKHIEYSKSWNDIRYEYYPYKVLILNNKTTIPRYSATSKLFNNPKASVNSIRNQMPIERWFDEYEGELNLYEWPYLFSDRIITFIEVEYPPIY